MAAVCICGVAGVGAWAGNRVMPLWLGGLLDGFVSRRLRLLAAFAALLLDLMAVWW